MNSKKRILTGLMALALLVAMAPMNQAAAGIVVRASVRTPHIAVRVNTAPAVRYSPRCTLPVRRGPEIVIDKQDRRIAKRLAKHTAYNKRELLQWRRGGHSWWEIGSWLNLRPQLVSSIINQRGHHDHGRVVRRGHH